jgi:hypothetical protein
MIGMLEGRELAIVMFPFFSVMAFIFASSHEGTTSKSR